MRGSGRSIIAAATLVSILAGLASIAWNLGMDTPDRADTPSVSGLDRDRRAQASLGAVYAPGHTESGQPAQVRTGRSKDERDRSLWGAAPATAQVDTLDPPDPVEPGQGERRSIGEPMDVGEDDQIPEDSVAIGETLDADHPELAPLDEAEQGAMGFGTPLDADAWIDDEAPAAEPVYIGDPLDAEAPGDS